jgi:hypothetical protein
MKKYKLPRPYGPYGYTIGQIRNICKKVGIHEQDFWNAFGVNTVAVDKSGKHNYYKCDIERALYRATSGIKGVNHAWD